jgi:hypothetical protein
MTKEYEYVVPNLGNTSLTTGTITWNDYWPTSTYYTYWYPQTIYKYQVFCPKSRCKGVTWGELNTTVTCPKCFSTIKLVSSPTPKPDYEVEVS